MSIVTGPKLPVMVSGASGDQYLSQGNAMLRMLQTLVQPNVKSMTLSSPPGSPVNGDTYVVASGAGGAWAGQTNSIAYWSTNNPAAVLGEWEFYTPAKGWMVGNQADGNLYVFSGSTWTALVVPGSPSGLAVIPLGLPLYNGTVIEDGPWGNTTFARIPGSMLTNFSSPWKMSFYISGFESGPPIPFAQFNNCVIARTARNSKVVLDTTPVTFGGTSAPVFTVLGEQTSDPITLALDSSHDYWFLFYAPFVSGNDMTLTFGDYSSSSYVQGLEGGMFSGDQTGAGTLPATMDGTRQLAIFLTEWITA